jgi:hypothetical protein
MTPQLIPIATWAVAVFGEHKPHANTLLNWVHGGKIAPAPMKIGRRYFCAPNARYVDPAHDEIQRMIDGR